jgi:hypothetical protein
VTRLLVTTIRNEAPYVLEWVAYHRMIGFDRILVYSNDCTDGTDTLLDALADRGLVIHERNEDYAKKGVQWTALERASSHPETRAADWVLFADIDEFVNVKAGAGRLDDLFAAVPEADAIALTWRLFGSAGTVEIADLPVIGQFTRAAPFPCHAPWTASQFKTLFRNDGAYRKLGVHRPKSPDPKRKGGIRWVNGSGCADHVEPAERPARPRRKAPAQDRAHVAFADVHQHAVFERAHRFQHLREQQPVLHLDQVGLRLGRGNLRRGPARALRLPLSS